MVELRVLRYFLAVAREGSISRAAQGLHVTQPTLSRQIMDLEQELGCRLLVRGPRRVTLTEEGVLLRKRAGEIVELVERTESEIRSSDEPMAGDIYVGGGETAVMRLVVDVMGGMMRDHPNVRFHIFSGDAEAVTERLDKGLLDFGLLIGSPKVARYDSIEVPATDRWGLLMRSDHPLAGNGTIPRESLGEVPLIASQQGNDEGTYGEGIDPKGLDIIATYNLVNNAVLMVEAGLGCALVIDNLVNTAGTDLVFVPLESEVRLRSYVVWKGSQPTMRAKQAFLERLRHAFAPADQPQPNSYA